MQPVHIRAAALFAGADRIIDSPVLTVEDGRITEIEEDGDLPVDGRAIDLPDTLLIPGLIDTHVHLASYPDLDNFATVRLTVAERAIRSAQNAERTLDAGFTAVRDCAAEFLIDVACRKSIERGIIRGPNMQVSCRGLSITGGHGDHENGFPPEVKLAQRYVVDGPDEVRRAVREQIRDGADWIKVAATGGVLSEGDKPISRGLALEELEVAVDEAAAAGIKVMSHAQGSDGIKNSILAGVHSIEHGFCLTEEIVQLMLDRDVFFVPTLVAGRQIVENGDEANIPDYALEKARDFVQQHRESFQMAHSAGVRIAMGTDAGTPFNYHGANASELGLMAEAGMSPGEVISAATTSAAELMGMGDRIGRLAVGFAADILAVDADILDDVSLLRDEDSVELIMKGGRIVKGAERCD